MLSMDYHPPVNPFQELKQIHPDTVVTFTLHPNHNGLIIRLISTHFLDSHRKKIRILTHD